MLTVFAGANRYRERGRTVADGRARQHPNLVLGPPSQAFQRVRSDVFHTVRFGFRVGHTALRSHHLVVDYLAVAPVGHRRLPLDQDRRGANGLGGYVLWRRIGHCYGA